MAMRMEKHTTIRLVVFKRGTIIVTNSIVNGAMITSTIARRETSGKGLLMLVHWIVPSIKHLHVPVR